MNLAKFSVKNSLLVNLISVFILLAGFYTLYVYKINREAFPEVSFDMVVITTPFAGAPPEELEKLVSTPLEKELKGVEGIEEMISVSVENISNILIKISQDVKDKGKVVDDIREAVDRVPDLPEDAEEPLVIEITSGEIPVIQVALSGDLPERELQGYAERLEDILENIPRVSSISRTGWRDSEVWVEVDPDKMKEFYLSLEEVMAALRQRNISIPAGKMHQDKEFSIRTTGEFHETEEIENVVIRANDVGNWLRVKDVSRVRFAFEDEDLINKSFGTRSINLTVIKKHSGDTIRVVDAVKRETELFRQQIPAELKISFIHDISFYIKRRLGVLRQNGTIGFFLVLCVLMIFLPARIAALTALGIPIAFSATLAVMGVTGITVNLITMFGLIVVLGMLVDDGIIVAENCARYLEKGVNRKEAAVIGTQEVIKPVTVTIITTIAAFSPLMFMEGMIGKFIWGIPMVVIIALLASLFEALVILPSHFADFVRIKRENFRSRKETAWFKRLLNFYTRVLNRALNRRYLVMVLLAAVLLLTFFVASKRPFILFGTQDIEEFYIRAEAPLGTSLYVTNELIGQIEEKVEQLPENELDGYTTQVGIIGETWIFDPYGKSGGHTAQVNVYVTPQTERRRTVGEIVDALRKEMKAVTGFEKIYFEIEREGPPVGKAVAAQVRGDDFAVLEKISAEIASFLESVDGVSDVHSDYELGRGEIRVIVDKDEAARAYLSVGEIAASIRYAFQGGIATSIKPTRAEEEIDVKVRFPEEYRNRKETFRDILVPNRFGNLIPLEKVARIEERTAVSRIRHLDGKRVITVRADVDNKKITSARANEILARKFKDLPKLYPGYSVKYGGEQEENIRATRSFIRAFGLAFVLIFFILAANFGSLIQPLIVMMAIPFGLIGVIWAFFAHGLPLSFFMLMGVVGLNGIVVNDSIVLVQFINNLRHKGVERRVSIVEAGQIRLRPVILTSVTTALGLTPTAYGIWGGDPFLRPMALSIIWGVMCATALTLLVIPCMYAIVDDVCLKITHCPTVKRDNGEMAE